MTTAKYVQEITVIDPDTNLPVELSIFKHNDSGGMFAIDSSFINQCYNDDVMLSDPFNENELVLLIGID
jgi:hypothetical protein